MNSDAKEKILDLIADLNVRETKENMSPEKKASQRLSVILSIKQIVDGEE